MSANFLNTNRNSSRFFFATSENGEQTLGLQYGTTGGAAPVSTMAVTISGSGGNGVIVTEAPAYLATEFMLAENALMGGTNSTYNTLSSINTSLVGFNISYDREGGLGQTTIENYAGNAGTTGFEFLNRGLNSQLQSTINVGINQYISSIGRPGAIAVLGGSGNFLCANTQASVVNSIDKPPNNSRVCFNISDLSGGNGVTLQQRWAIGTTNNPTGGNLGADWNLFSYNDNGTFLSTPLVIKRSDASMYIQNLSSVTATASGQAAGRVFPIVKDNVEFGAPNDVAIIAGATSNQTLFGSTYAPLFSTPVSNLNPNLETLLNVNFLNSLSTGSNHVTYKIGFSTSTAYTNILQTAFVPGSGGTWTPSDLPGANTPIGATNVCAVFDPDGLDATGAGFLYVLGQLSDPGAAADQIYIAKGVSSEPTRNALTYRTI